MVNRSDFAHAERANIRAEMATIVSQAGHDGRSVKESLYLAAQRLGLNFRRARAFRAMSADAWAYEADRLRRYEPDMLRAEARALQEKIRSVESRLAAKELGASRADKNKNKAPGCRNSVVGR